MSKDKCHKLEYIEINQPIGTMYLVKLPASIVSQIAATQTRKAYNDNQTEGYIGIQRKLEDNRVKAIANYYKSRDAMFPTPIILSAPSKYFVIDEDTKTITVSREGIYCSIIDGQHRIEGIKASGLMDKFELLVEFVFDTDPARDAYLFSIINGNQKPVSKSLIYDLFGVSKARTVEKLCNKVMRELNTNEKSLMMGRIKMLGYKDEFSPNGVVSQARLVDELIKYITDDVNRDNYDLEVGNYLKQLNPEKYIFRESFINDDDEEIIYKNIIFFNNWLESIDRWKTKENSEKSILEKSLGFSAAYRLLSVLYNDIDDYQLKLNKIIKSFFFFKLNEKTYSSSESGIVDLLYTLIAIGMQEEAIEENKVSRLFNPNQIQKIIEIQQGIYGFKNQNKLTDLI